MGRSIQLKNIRELTPQQRRDFQDFTNDLLAREYIAQKHRKRLAGVLQRLELEIDEGDEYEKRLP